MKALTKVVLVTLVVGAGGGYYAWRQQAATTETSQAGRPGGGPGGGRRGAAGGRGDMPTSVLTSPARYADVPVTLVAVGTAQALNTVTVRPQVDGKLVEVAFREGQEVRRGDVVARIDPTIYQAAYDQAVAKKAQDEATLANARVDLTRYVNLAQTNYGSKQQADTQRASVAQLEAQVKSDQGAIDSARAYLDFTNVVAPIDGRTGIRVVDQGNIVKASDAGGLVVITQIRPITVLFNLAQQNLRAVNAAAARGEVAVEAFDSDNRTVVDRGTLAVVDNQVDQTTGTVKLKATFPNAEQQLWPGQFVNVRLTVDTLRNVVTVPTAAIQRGPNGPFVYGVENDKAALKTVVVGRQDESIAVLTAGITPPEQVITTGFARLTDGDRVRVAAGDGAGEARPIPSRPVDGQAAEPRRPQAGAEAGGRGEGRRIRPDGTARPEGERGNRRRGPETTGSAAPAMPGGLPPSAPQEPRPAGLGEAATAPPAADAAAPRATGSGTASTP